MYETMTVYMLHNALFFCITYYMVCSKIYIQYTYVVSKSHVERSQLTDHIQGIIFGEL